MRIHCRLSLYILLWMLLGAAGLAYSQEADSLRQKQQTQAQARALAEELVNAVLDIQLRQLTENGLGELPLARDVAAMKQQIATLAQGEMRTIVQLLSEAHEANPTLRDEKLNQARGKIRDVVARLIAERQRLYRRMNTLRLSAEARQLLVLQAKTRETTLALGEARQQDRDRIAVEIIDDQADVAKMFYQLVQSLDDVRSWGGEASLAAADGLRILRTAQVELELRNAGQRLAAANFQAAAGSQANVLKGLATLLQRLDEAQGLQNGDQEAALRLMRELIERQSALRERAAASELTARTTEPLIEEQVRIQKELGKLPPALAKFPQADSLMEAAKAASFAATAGLFEENKKTAAEQQNRVVNSLTQIATILEQSQGAAHAAKSSAELAAECQQLAAVVELLERATEEQVAAGVVARDDPQVAAQRQQRVSDATVRAREIDITSDLVRGALSDVSETVEAAKAELREHSPLAANRRHIAAERALAVIRAAGAEAHAHLADARRWHKAVVVGELARAAEALERAAAAEEEISAQVSAGVDRDGNAAERWGTLIREQADIAAVAERVANGVTDTSPRARENLNDALPAIGTVSVLLKSDSDAAAAPDNQTIITVSTAKTAAAKIVAAAAELRHEQGRAAQELGKIAGQQFDETESARKEVEILTDSTRKSIAATMQSLQQAREVTRQALVQQLHALGRPVEADATVFVEQLSNLRKHQQAAGDAAEAIAIGRSNNPLAAATLQQEVADRASQLGAASSEELARMLQDAARFAGVAARETLNGNASAADQARRQVHEIISQALGLAEKLVRQAAEVRPTAPDAAAQTKVAEKARAAHELVVVAEKSIGELARSAAEALSRALQESDLASQQSQSGDLQAAATQQRTYQWLTRSVERLDEAVRELAALEFERLRAVGQQAAEFAEHARRIDPGAAAALSQASMSLGGEAQRQEQLLESGQRSRQKIEQAMASLAARSQELRRDRDLSLAMEQLAAEQQAARDAILSAARKLEKKPADDSDQASRLMAAQSLQQAQYQFAAAQTATGEAAAEVSGQQEVANQPIREALEIASRLNLQQMEEEAKDEKNAAGKGEGDQPPSESASNEKSTTRDAKATQLGTKMVPNSPQTTAKQLASKQANKAAASTMASAMKGKAKSGESEGESESPMEGASSSSAKKGGATKGGKTAADAQDGKGDLEKADAATANSQGEPGGQDVAPNGRGFETEAWFAKLPPSLRSAIQAKTRGKAPRGYEERLRRYFESVD